MKELSEYDKKRLKKHQLIIVFLSIFCGYGLFSLLKGIVVYQTVEGIEGPILYTLINGVWLYFEVKLYKTIKEGEEYEGLEDWEIKAMKDDEDKDIK